MIRFKKDALIIELPTNSPFETLPEIQRALTDAVLFRDTGQHGERVDMMLYHLAELLSATHLNGYQMSALGEAAPKMPADDRKLIMA